MDELDWDDFKKEMTPKTKQKPKAPAAKAAPKKQPVAKKAPSKPAVQPSGFTNFVDSFSYKAERNLKKGDVTIDAKLDLHGLFLEDAHQRALTFIKNAYAAGHRTVLIITGKGAHETGAIKNEFPHWLQDPALKQIILRSKSAHGKHGGDGAYYIFLKKNKV